MAVSKRNNKVNPSAVSASLADYLLEISIEKWEAGPPLEELRLKRYRGNVPVAEGRSLFHDARWTTNDEDLLELSKEIEFWQPPTPDSRGEGALAFMREVTGFKPRPYQEEVVRRLYKKRRLCVRSPRGAGKSAIAANIILHFFVVHNPCKVPTTAGSWAQLEDYLWPEIHLWAGRADWSLLGIKPKINLLDMSIGGSDDGLIKPAQKSFAIRSDEPEKLEGAHSENVLCVFDEAKVIDEATFDAVEGTLSHEGAFALVISTPGSPQGRFYDIQSRKKGFQDWDVMHITFQAQVDALEGAKRDAKIAWANARREQWGEDSPMFKNHVLGEFADTGDDNIIPLEWVMAAVERWKKWRDRGFPEGEEWIGKKNLRAIGADIAGQGKDRTCLSFRMGYAIKEITFKHKASTMDTANKLMSLAGSWPVIRIEADGMGVGVFDRCREIKTNQEQEYRNTVVQSVIAGSKTTSKDKSGELGFWNMRSFLWWRMREMLEPGSGYDVMLPDDAELIGDLTTPKWELREGAGEFKGRIKVEGKDDIRKRLGRSTDAADAVIISLAEDIVVIVTETVRVQTSVPDKPGTTFYDAGNPRRSWPGWSGYR
jgi:hypothetical protein